MLKQVMEYCNNFFAWTVEEDQYEITVDSIKGSFDETYVVGQYISIDNSFLNDGVYKISAVGTNELTLDATLQVENTGETLLVYGLRVPTDFLTVVEEITTYNSSVTYGVKSESQGQRSVSYGSGSGDSSWQSVYANMLTPYKRMYCDKNTFDRGYNIYTKGWK